MILKGVKSKILIISFAISLFPFWVSATEGEFSVDPSYDLTGRSKINAFLHQLGEKAYFFVEEDFYKTLDIAERIEFTEALRNLAQEFDGKIYPMLTVTFGGAWNPGIDNDQKIYILITQIKGEAGGYFNSADEYPKIQSPESNEKEIIYLNTKFITGVLAKNFLAHEFLHLITFNQKERILGTSEEVWLNEGRAELAPALLGYDTDYQNSNLKRRVRTFLEKPGDSLTEWRNETPDYGALNIFFQYLVDHYGVKVLADSLKSAKTGIPSLNEALLKNGFSEDFSTIFTNWTIAVLVNDCNLGPKYCYLNPNLKSIRISPQLNFLPSTGESSLTLSNFSKDWAGNWYKFIGGQGSLKLEFIGEQKGSFKIPYLLEESSGKYDFNFFALDNLKRGTSYFNDWGKKYVSLTILPTIQTKLSGFDGLEDYTKFIWTASTLNEDPSLDRGQEMIKILLAQIASLQEQIARLQIEIAKNLAQNGGNQASCSKLESNLSFGTRDNNGVRCLQTFLKNQGLEIYPEGLVTGNFFSATRSAVVRFQEKYASEILAPLGLKRGTGVVGPATLVKINSLLAGR